MLAPSLTCGVGDAAAARETQALLNRVSAGNVTRCAQARARNTSRAR